MSGYFIKGAGERQAYAVDWAARHLRDGEAVSADLGWAITPSTGAVGELAVASSELSGATTSVSLEAGVPGCVYVATSTVQTSLNRVLSHAVAVRISAEV